VKRNLGLAAWLALALVVPAAHSRAAEPAPLPAPSDQWDEDVDPAATAAVDRVSEFLRKQPRFSFSADIAYEVRQEDGSTLEFGDSRKYTVRRPDRLRIDADRRADGERDTFFDGDRITVWSPAQKAYAFVKLKQHRSLDEAIHIIRDRLGIPMPLGELLADDPGHGLEGTFESGFLVGEEVLDGVTTEHVALRNEDTDVELWVAKGDTPFVMRVHIAYHSLPAQPRFTARLFGWSLTPDTPDALFQFAPPADAERVRFAFGGSGTPPPPEPAKEKKP
jgi:hypothetical protein